MKKIFKKLKTINETALACIALLIVATRFGFYASRDNDSLGFKCPSDFELSQQYEYIDSVASWISKYTKKHPKASTKEMLAARNKLMDKYKCKESPFTLDDSAKDLLISDQTGAHEEKSQSGDYKLSR